MQASQHSPKKKICIINFFVYNMYNNDNEKIFGGAEVQLHYIMEALQQKGHFDINVLSELAETPEIIQKNGITFWRVHNMRNVPFRNLYNLLKLFWYFRRISADVYMNRAASLMVGLTALYCKLFFKRSVYMTAHDLDVDGSFEKNSSWLVRTLYRYGLTHTDSIIAQNQHHADLLQKNYSIPQEKIVWIPNSFALPDRSNIVNNPNSLLWVGRAVDWKQPEKVFMLAKEFPLEQFVMIINPQDDSVLRDVLHTAKQHTNVEVITGVPFFKIDQYFKNAKLFINTSTAEGFPNTFIQAGMYGCPIVSLAVNPDNMLTKHAFGWYADNNDKQFIELTRSALANDTLRKTYASNARDYVERNHDISKNIERLIKQL